MGWRLTSEKNAEAPTRFDVSKLSGRRELHPPRDISDVESDTASSGDSRTCDEGAVPNITTAQPDCHTVTPSPDRAAVADPVSAALQHWRETGDDAPFVEALRAALTVLAPS